MSTKSLIKLPPLQLWFNKQYNNNHLNKYKIFLSHLLLKGLKDLSPFRTQSKATIKESFARKMVFFYTNVSTCLKDLLLVMKCHSFVGPKFRFAI